MVHALRITLLGDKPKVTETAPEAYAPYLQARYLINQPRVESFAQAEALLKKVLAIDPGFAPAWTDLGYVYWRQTAVFGTRPTYDGSELARHAIQQSLVKDPQYGRAYAILSMIETRYDWDFKAASEHVRQARALNPGDAFVIAAAAGLKTILGRVDEAIDLSRQAVHLDPVSPILHAWLGYNLWVARRLDEAEASLKMATSLGSGRYKYRLGHVLLAQGDAVAALATIQRVQDDGLRLTGMAIVNHALGDAGASDAALQELIDKFSENMAFQIAEVHAYRGATDLAFNWLEQAYEDRDAGLAGMLVHPLLANLHDDPRWVPFLDKMGLPH